MVTRTQRDGISVVRLTAHAANTNPNFQQVMDFYRAIAFPLPGDAAAHLIPHLFHVQFVFIPVAEVAASHAAHRLLGEHQAHHPPLALAITERAKAISLSSGSAVQSSSGSMSDNNPSQ